MQCRPDAHQSVSRTRQIRPDARIGRPDARQHFQNFQEARAIRPDAMIKRPIVWEQNRKEILPEKKIFKCPSLHQLVSSIMKMESHWEKSLGSYH
jgi:hypothetical protein